MSINGGSTNPIFNAKYKNIPIKSDSRVHGAVLAFFGEMTRSSYHGITVLDVATGKGALAQAVIDGFPGIAIDCNDLEPGVMATGVRATFCKDLNCDFDFQCKYDVILAVEIIEHLENPFHFVRTLKNHLNPNGLIILTTPNLDSFFDRLWFLYHGYPHYFGARGIVNSGGHITMCPEWLLRHIAEKYDMQFHLASDSIDSKGLVGKRSQLLMSLLYPLRFVMKNLNDRSGNVCIFRKKS